ncbi:MAG: cytochrome C oxidase subunit IV family protein [Acidobacteriota bacterium]
MSEHGGSVRSYMTVWFALLAMTAIEVVLAYQALSVVQLLLTLVGLSVVKAGLIIAYFMHLKFERRSLVLTLLPMLILCILLLFAFFPDSLRLLKMRV